ncbi:MAG: hypothetical protein D4R39_00740 [Methylophilaceae bacterium]|nr:MAG: hypothetical protein D4R39_00740 [Methylophilaceae bacterium]
MKLDDTTTIDPPKEREDCYLKALVELSEYAAKRGELEHFVNTCLRQLSWVAATRNNPLLASTHLFAKLAAQVESDTLYFEEQAAREKAERESQSVH